jgi:hypothetical protein
LSIDELSRFEFGSLELVWDLFFGAWNFIGRYPFPAIPNPKSLIRNPQSAIENPLTKHHQYRSYPLTLSFELSAFSFELARIVHSRNP